MNNASATKDELKILQREAAQLEERRKQIRANKVEETGRVLESDSEKIIEHEDIDKEAVSQSEKGFHDIAGHLEMYLKEIEDVAIERPALALLAAFAVGVIVGQLYSRK